MELTQEEIASIEEQHIIKQSFMLKIHNDQFLGIMISTADTRKIADIKSKKQFNYETVAFRVGEGGAEDFIASYKCDGISKALSHHEDFIKRFVEDGYKLKDMA